ncbi:MAG: DUF3887 domain-containing protein [Dehalococcoidales bacterium]|nr:DUF3887 domain-containing protein [Dehalococcoidales bacterium]
MRKIILTTISVILLLATALTGCGQSVSPPTYALPTVEAMLQAMNNGDFESYTASLNAEMKEGIPEYRFLFLKNLLEGKIGQYESMELTDTQVNGTEITITYKAKYSLVEEVVVTATFDESGEEPLVSFFSWKSKKLDLPFAQVITEMMLQSFNMSDFISFSLFMTENMYSRYTEDIFNTFQKFYDARIGSFVSLNLENTEVENAQITATYKATYSKADDVIVTAVLIVSGDYVFVDDLYIEASELWTNN